MTTYFTLLKKNVQLGIIIVFLTSCNSWSSETEEALKQAGNNRGELERVLRHYAEVDPDSLKFKAAEYLISNMIYQYSRFGPDVDSLDKMYQNVYEVYRNDRNAVFMSDSLRKGKHYQIEAEYDLLRLTSDHLIKQIESAFETYNRFEWCRLYPFETFCEYILPFNIKNADSALWRNHAYQKYGPLLEYAAFKKPESHYEAELQAQSKTLKVRVEGASQHFTYNLQKENAEPFRLKFHTRESGYQLFNIHYLNGHTGGARVSVMVDNLPIGDVIFPATGDWQIIDKEVPPVDFTVMLDSGHHTLKLIALDKNILVDFVEVPEYIYMKSSNSPVEQGRYYLSNRLGPVTVPNDTLINGSQIKIHSNRSEGRPVKILTKGNFYEMVFEQKSGLKKAIDAYPAGETDWVHLYDDLGFANQLWAFIPMEQGGYQIRNKETGRILGFRENDSTLAQLPANLMRDDYIWHLERIPNDSVADLLPDMAVRTAQNISEITNRFHWSGSYVDLGPINPNIVLDYAYGSCVEETAFQTMVLRSMGIACAVDFVFNYPERNAGHTWSVIFDLKGNTVQNNCHNPVGAGTWVDIFAKGKVYRKTNTINRKSLMLTNNNEEPIPVQFQNPYFIDVTKEYCKVRDIEVRVFSDTITSNRFGYLMVFNNDGWVPIGWGEKGKGDKIKFKDVEPGPMYMPAFYTNGSFEAFNAPFRFDSLGNMHWVKIRNDSLTDMSITRKSPNRTVNETHHKLIIGGKFQGANRADFSDAVTIGTITDQMLEPVFHVINSSSQKSFKYLRYIGPDEGRCNINEMIFFDAKGDTINGNIIGTEGSFEYNGKTKEMVFDGDVLTYFDAPDPSGGWVGLQLRVPTVVSKIRFATRNDGNMIEVGDEYELVYWDYKKWKSLGRKVATTDSVTYDKVPKGALYWLQNHTKGWEERIFTIDENGRQVWW